MVVWLFFCRFFLVIFKVSSVVLLEIFRICILVMNGLCGLIVIGM